MRERFAIVKSGTGIWARASVNARVESGEVAISLKDNPLLNDHNETTRPSKWNFPGWSVNQDALDKQQEAKDAQEALKSDKIAAHARIKARIDDLTTDWKDPQGDLMKELHEDLEKLLR